MLKDRRELLEHDLKVAQEAAGHMYFDIVRSNGDVHSEEYHALREKVGQLQFDLSIVVGLIEKGAD